MKKANDMKLLAIHAVSNQSVVDDIKKLYPGEDFTDVEFIYVGVSKIKKEKPKTNPMLTDLEKQLIVLSAHGIYITHQDGYRWIERSPLEYYNYDEELSEHGIMVNNKIYGGVKEAIAVVDETWKMMYGETLVETFDYAYYARFDIDPANAEHGRITKVEPGHGGLM